MPEKPKLSKSMTEEQFENGYWYALEVKAFADEIGIPLASRLRKDELEDLIRRFLRTGEVKGPTRNSLSRSGAGYPQELPSLEEISPTHNRYRFENSRTRRSSGRRFEPPLSVTRCSLVIRVFLRVCQISTMSSLTLREADPHEVDICW